MLGGMPRALGSVLVILLASSGWVAGCTSDPLSTLRVTVRDAVTADPVTGARVEAATAARTHPLPWAYGFAQPPAASTIGHTDDLGEARVQHPANRPVRIAIFAPGYPIVTEIIDRPWVGREVVTAPAAAGRPGLSVEVETIHGSAAPAKRARR